MPAERCVFALGFAAPSVDAGVRRARLAERAKRTRRGGAGENSSPFEHTEVILVLASNETAGRIFGMNWVFP
ncbi:hypothetical protein COMA2_90149 [Candidatus Nitrospira nitrificans]|uniref:Uncharacterized protein n=1 Tax=Candidatus Nitrospira nitrificans TaxID=1742973 RepID=A0A0S4LYB1_9BACT|nr:hypothetical protein COMA2_90149 [Candidatus Nitrospira nitrificans]